MLTPFGRAGSPFRELEQLRREMNRLFTEFPTSGGLGAAQGFPAMNVWMSQDSAIVTAELPGCNPDDIEISVAEGALTVKGTRIDEALPEEALYHRRERRSGSFSRTFTLPFEIDADNVEANFERGVLNITLPRAEHDKPRKITIKAE